MTNPPDTTPPPDIAAAPFQRAPRLPSLRASAALAAGMLAIGVAVGAAIGPAPSASLAGEQAGPLVLRSIANLTARRSGVRTGAQIAQPPIEPQTTRTSHDASTLAAAETHDSKTLSGGAKAPPAKAIPAPMSPAPTDTSGRLPAHVPRRTRAGPHPAPAPNHSSCVEQAFASAQRSLTSSNQPRRTTLHPLTTAHRKALLLAAIVGCSVGPPLVAPAIGHAEETNPNNYSCAGGLSAGKTEVGSEEQQVAYAFHCSGPITGYQLQSQIPVTGVQAAPLVSNIPSGKPVNDTFSCSSEVPGYADNCVGATLSQYETIAGQFAIGSKLCAEPRVDALLTVTYAYLEKGAVTQAISGPFDLGRPAGCPPDAQSGWTRLNPKPVVLGATGKHHGRGHKGNHGNGHGRKASKKRS